MDKAELDKILAAHAKWLVDPREGEHADLRRANLGHAGLREADLREADLGGADLRDADLREADLRDAGLREADLRDADLGHADLREADLGGANLRRANLRDADLGGADLRDADLRHADLTRVILCNCDLDGARISYRHKEVTVRFERAAAKGPAQHTDEQQVVKCAIVVRDCWLGRVHIKPWTVPNNPPVVDKVGRLALDELSEALCQLEEKHGRPTDP